MENKKKRCKGQSKAINFKGCGQLSAVRKHGLCSDCWREFLLTTPEGAEIISKSRLTAKNKLTKIDKKIAAEQKDKNVSIQAKIALTRKPFQQWIRLRDANFGCISCGTTVAEVYHSGHLYKAEIYSGLIFDEMNVHKQCNKCNTYLSGNENGYRQGLARRYGASYLEELDERAIYLRNHSYTREELKTIADKYKQLLKQKK